ncbi:Non-lysosomal glucosylceramidase, partial [Danaus plexippus plexippus]
MLCFCSIYLVVQKLQHLRREVISA